MQMFRKRVGLALPMALCLVGCDFAGRITFAFETDGGPAPADAGSVADGAAPSDVQNDVAAVDAGASDVMNDTGALADVVMATDVPVMPDVVAADTGSTADSGPSADVGAGSDVPAVDVPVADTGDSDFAAGSACVANLIRACRAATTCLTVIQYCDRGMWTPCYVQANTCTDAGSSVDASVPVDVVTVVDVTPSPSLCPCTGRFCDVLLYCTTPCNTAGMQTVGEYCSPPPIARCHAISPFGC